MTADVIAGALPQAESTPRRRVRVSQGAIVWALRLLLLAVIIGGWFALSSQRHWRLVLSTPGEVASLLKDWTLDSTYRGHLMTTLTEAFFGFLLGILAALVLLVIVSTSSVMDRYLSPFITAVAVIPKLALTPLFVLWFGLTVQAKIYFVALAIFFIIFQGVHTGLKTIDHVLIENQQALGSSSLRIILNVYLPSVLTWVMSSLRISASWALLAAVGAEYLGSREGIGFLIYEGQTQYNPAQVIAGILVIAAVALVFDRLLRRTDRALSKWRLF